MSLAVVRNPLRSKSDDGMWFLSGHNSDVLSIATDGSDVFATCDAGGVGLLWKYNSSACNGEPAHVCGIKTGGSSILDACFLNHTRLCTAQGDGNLGVWDVETARCIHSICRTSSGRGRSIDWPVINALTVLGGSLIAYGGDDGFLVLCDSLQNKILSTINMRVPITSLVAYSDSLFVGDVLGGIRCFDTRVLRSLYTLRTHRDVVSSLVLNDDATMLVSYGMDNLLTLWDVAPFALSASDRLLHRSIIDQGDSRKLLRCDWSKKGSILVPAGAGQIFHVNASMFEGVKMTLPVSHREGPAQCAVFLGDEVAASGAGAEVIVQPARVWGGKTVLMGGTSGRRGKPRYLLSAEDTPEGTFAVIDPLSQRLFVPQTSMIDTLAIHREGVPSLCRLYLQGRCRQGNLCYQAHADATVVQKLREIALKEPTCCGYHGASSDTTGLPGDMMVIVTEGKDQGHLLRTTLAHVTITKGLRVLLKKHHPEDNSAESAFVPLSSLCRLHSSGPCCHFGHECNFVHLCRDLIAEVRNRKKERIEENASMQPTLVLPPTPQVADASPVVLSSSQSNPSNVTLQDESALFMGISPVRFAFSHPTSLSKHTSNGAVSFSGTPKLSTSPGLSRSYNSTSVGIVWRHNPYGGTSSASSAIET